MGYNLIIGEAEIQQDGEWISVGAAPAAHDEAPAHCRFTGNGNSRSPGYTAWSDFCTEAGIYPMFYGAGWSRNVGRYVPAGDDFYRETPILNEHPGATGLIAGDLEYVTAARIRREQSNGGRPPGFWEDGGIDNGTDPTLARLLWLEYWIGWALGNCKHPVLANS